MRLDRFRLRGFAQHQDLDLVFSDEFPNLIIGPNEAGKSHLMTGLLGTLYGIGNYEPYTPWYSEPVMTGTLWFTAGGDQVVLERRFAEEQVEVNVNGQQVYRGRGLVHGRAGEDDQYRKLLRDWVGFSEPEVFERTVFVKQDLVLDQELGNFSAQIKRLISGTREANYETAIKDLDAELDKLIKRPGKRNNRQREDLLEELEKLRERHRIAEQVQAQVIQLVEEEHTLNAQIEEAKDTQERYSALVERYGDYQALTRQEQEARQAWTDHQRRLGEMEKAESRRAELIEQRDRLRIPGDPAPDDLRKIGSDIDRLHTEIGHLQDAVQRNESIRSERARLERALEDLRIPGDPEPEQIQRLEWQIRQASDRVDHLNARIDEESREPEPAPKQPQQESGSMRTGLIATAAFWALASIVLGAVVDPLLLLLIVFAAIPLAIGLLTGRAENKVPAETAAEPDPRQQRLDTLARELDEARNQLRDLEARRDEYLQATGLDTLEQLHERASRREQTQLTLNAQPEVDEAPAQELAAKQAELQDLQARRDDWLQSTGEQDLASLIKRADDYRETLRLLEQLQPVDQDEKKSLQARLDKAQQDAIMADRQRKELLEEHPEIETIPAQEIESYRQSVERAAENEQRARDRLRDVSYQRQQLGRGADDAEALRLEIEETQAELERVEIQAEAHELAIQTLHDSVQQFQEHALDPVAEDAARYFGSITDGRYDGVTIDRDTMIPTVYGNGRGQIDFERLSRGARDQLYLAIRAALIDALSGERDLPLVLDDPCVHFDEERLAATAELIAGIARERQILLFTKDETWARWFDPVLRLERRDASVAS